MKTYKSHFQQNLSKNFNFEKHENTKQLPVKLKL